MKKIWMILLILALLTGCGAPAAPKPADGKLHIVATVFPAYDFARAAAGDLADVELLLPPQAARAEAAANTPVTFRKLRRLILRIGISSFFNVEPFSGLRKRSLT